MSDVPTAISRPKRRWSWAWLIPVLALFSVASLIYLGMREQGIAITILFKEGHGLKVGDRLRYRGIDVGEVSHIDLTEDAHAIQVIVQLTRSAEIIARKGNVFWIERPRISLRNISGLETLLGANYLRVLPVPEGVAQYSFIGLEEPPLKNLLESGGLEITLLAKGMGALQRGAPISYRQIVIGTITEVDLARDASAVMAIAYIRPKYTSLIRENTRFWRSPAVSFDAGWLRGISVELASVQALLDGGVNIAIPEVNAGAKVEDAYQFTLYDEPEPEWVNWRPYLPLEELQLSQSLPKAEILTASLVWEEGNAWTFNLSQQVRHSTIFPVEGGFLGASNSLLPPKRANEGKTYLNLADIQINLIEDDILLSNDLAFLPLSHNYEPWKFRLPEIAEDTFVYIDKESRRFVAAHHYKQEENHWQLNDTTTFDFSWHGALVVSAKDDFALGILLLDKLPKVAFWVPSR